MAYVALYRAHRPQKFSEVAGQKHIVKTLQNAIKLDKVAHAYLFCGPRGTGKTTLAKIVAKTLNCENLVYLEPCNTCQTCIDINKSMVSDVIEIDAASNNGVDEIRELRDKVKFPPINKYKVYIIDEVHMLTTAAFNALLKTLEEPPKNTIFILATTEVQKIPLTILSRCQRFDFTSITSKDVYNRIKDVCDIEKIKIEDEALVTISEECEGGLRDALSLLDQCISYSTSNQITQDDVLSVSGSIKKEILLEIFISCIKNDGPQTLKLLNDLIDTGKELPKITNDLISFLRDTLLFKVNAHEINKQVFKDKNFKEFSASIKSKQIYNYLNILNEAQNNMRFSTQKKTFLELALLSMADVINDDNSLTNDKLTELEDKVKKLEELVKNLSNKEISTYESVTTPVVNKKQVTDEEYMDFHEEPITSFEEIIKIEELEEDNITVKMLEDILNNGNKEKKKDLQDIIKNINKLNQTSDVEILSNSQVVAASNNSCILILETEIFCNRLMRTNTYSLLLELINNEQHIIDEFLCIPSDVWKKIKDDYLFKYKNSESKKDIKLDDIKINIKKPVFKKIEKEIDSDIEEILELFDPSIVKIKEN